MESREKTLASARTIVVKVGSAVLTTKQGLHLSVLYNLVEQLARLAASGHRVCLVSSGAVAAGRTAIAGRGCTVEGVSGKQALAAIGQGRLMREYEHAFAAQGMVCAQVLLTRDDLRSRTRFLNARNTFMNLLDWGVVPIVNENDTVAVQELKFGDNDQLASLLLNLIEADLYINLTSADGVLAANPETAAPGEKIPFLEKFVWARENDKELYQDLCKLVVKSNTTYFFNENRISAYYAANFNVTKELGKWASITLYARNFLYQMGKVKSSQTGLESSLFDSNYIPKFYYGMSVRIKL